MFIKGQIVKHHYDGKYGKIRGVDAENAHMFVDWFVKNDKDPCFLGDVDLFCQGIFESSCEKCDIRHLCYTN